MFLAIILLLSLLIKTEGSFYERQCVKITSWSEDYIAGSWELVLDFEPISCEGKKMDPSTIQTGLRTAKMDKVIISEMKTHLDPRFFKIGTELMVVTNRISKRGVHLGLGVAFWAFGGLAAFTAISGIILSATYGPKNRPAPKYVKHFDSENSNYLNEIRKQEIKDAEYKLQQALAKAKSLEPNAVAPAKQTGKRGEWCTAVTSKVVFDNNNRQVSAQNVNNPGPSGNGPTPPPTPSWTKGTPAPKVVTEKPKKRKNEPFLRNPKVVRLSEANPAPRIENVNPGQEIEVVELSDDSDIEVIVNEDRAETHINVQPGSSLVVQTRTCESLNPIGVREFDHFSEAAVVYVSSSSSSEGNSQHIFELSDDGSQPGSPARMEGVLPFTEVIANLPAVRVYPSPIYQNDYLSTSNISPAESSWWGVGWSSTLDSIGNTCILDSFLSHMAYLHRRDTSYFNNVLRLMDNPAENAIRRIAHLSRRQGFTEAQRSRQIHLAWTSAFPHIFNKVKVVDGEERIDCAGSEHQSIVVPMQNSSQIWIAHQCQCENSDPLMRPDTVRNFGNINWSAETIGWFRTLDITADETNPRNVIGNQNCDACKSVSYTHLTLPTIYSV